ncbi:MAG TPA: hypothetical protein VGD71_11650 [Kribbella sp.]
MNAISDASGDDLIPLTVNEIGRLFAQRTRPNHPDQHHDAWSYRRRRHQARARRCHYRRRLSLHRPWPSR